MTAIPLRVKRSVSLSLHRLSTQQLAFGIVVLISFLTTSCATSGLRATSSSSSQNSAVNLSISSSLPSAVAGSPYNAVLAVTGGTRPYQFSINAGTLPPGLSLNGKTGTISGVPTNVSKYSFTVSVTDPEGGTGNGVLSLSVGASAPAVTLSVSPSTETVASGGTQQFVASVHNTSNTAVQWTTTAGKISPSGLFTAPSSTSSQTAVVTATSVAYPSAQASATVTITKAASPPPPQPASSSPTSAADNQYCGSGDQANFGSTDGPATLPQKCIYTALSGTPSAGKQTLVPAGANANIALENAACGDVILLQAGATFKGPITLPAKNCDPQHWITLRTSAADSSLPPEGTRITPCYAGISSLPGRPTYSCSSARNVLAKIQIANGAGAITVAEGANYYRIIGLEVTRQSGTGVVYGLVKILGAADHLIFDRVWMHGTALDETTRGVYLGEGTNVAVIDSYLNDFHCIARTGACTDSQTINGGNGLLPTGPYKIVNNFLESAAENILLGGANQVATVPADIEIRRNHMFKPLSWMPKSSTFIGVNFIAKNLFEVKNAERLLFEGNVMENSWGGFSQVGWGMVLTPRGSWAADRDITIRYNTISHVGAGFQICATQDMLPSGQKVDSLASEHISIHDVTVDDMSASTYNGDGIGFQISSGFMVNTPLNNVTINHVTMMTDPNKTLLVVGAEQSNPMLPFNIVFTNNIAVAGKYSVWSTGGIVGACAKSGQPLITFNQCWSSYTATDNVLIAYPSSQGPWPQGNFFASSDSAAGLTSTGTAGTYELLSSSPYEHMASDGTPLGADVNTIAAKTAGVQ